METIEPSDIKINMVAYLKGFAVPEHAKEIKSAYSKDAILVLVKSKTGEYDALMYQFLTDSGRYVIKTTSDLKKTSEFLMHLKAVENRSKGNSTIKAELKVLRKAGCGW